MAGGRHTDREAADREGAPRILDEEGGLRMVVVVDSLHAGVDKGSGVEDIGSEGGVRNLLREGDMRPGPGGAADSGHPGEAPEAEGDDVLAVDTGLAEDTVVARGTALAEDTGQAEDTAGEGVDRMEAGHPHSRVGRTDKTFFGLKWRWAVNGD